MIRTMLRVRRRDYIGTLLRYLPTCRTGMLPGVKAAIVSIGTELTNGLTVDTNSAWLSLELASIGWDVGLHVTVPDDRDAIAAAVRQGVAQSDAVFVNGGLGPTADDLTRESISEAVGQGLSRDPELLRQIESYFDKLGRSMPESNKRQADIPIGGHGIANTCGTAPGVRVMFDGKTIYAMPGVPREMKVMFERSILPELPVDSNRTSTVVRTIRCFGAGEANIGEQIADLMTSGRQPVVGITAHDSIISVRVIARDAAIAEAEVADIRGRLGQLVFGEDATTLQSAVGQLLLDQKVTVSVAESCTGGMLGGRLTDVSGSSGYFQGGVVTYAYEAKTDLLGVPADLMMQKGAVNGEVASMMASACRRRFGTDYALSITGVAGPGGGSDEKPVGLVWFGLADAGGVVVEKRLFGTHLTRWEIRDRACKVALNLLRLRMTGESG